MPIGLRRRDRWKSFGFNAGVCLAATLTIAAAGCGFGDPENDSIPAATATPTIEPTPARGIELGAVIWSNELDELGAPIDNLAEFSRFDPVIHAVVEIENVPAGEILTAVWSLDGVPIDAIESTVTIEDGAGSGWVAFTLLWEGESLWPVGTLDVAITSTSGVTTTGSIQITTS